MGRIPKSHHWRVTKNGKELFVKVYGPDSQESVKQEFERIERIRTILKTTSMPRGVSYDEEHRSLMLEHVEGVEFKRLLFTKSNRLKQEPPEVERVLVAIAQDLARIHKQLRFSKERIVKIPGLDEPPVAILGDLCSSNVLIGESIYLVDPMPKEYLFGKGSPNIRTSRYVELAQLLLTLHIHPLIHIPFLCIDHRRLRASMLKAYEKAARIKLDPQKLQIAQNYILDRISRVESSTPLGLIRKSIYRRLQRTVYTVSHQGDEFGERYDEKIANRFEHTIFTLEKESIHRALKRYFPKRVPTYLDFACGTGRITQVVEPHSDKATGVDISEDMLKRARKKVKAKLVKRNLLEEPLKERFALITAFRFFLNAEEPLRVAVLKTLRAHLTPEGILIVNNHMNRSSLIGFQFYLRKLMGAKVINTISNREMVRLLESTGFDVVERVPIAHLPGRLNWLPLPQNLFLRVERFLTRTRALAFLAKDTIFICTKSKSTRRTVEGHA